MASGTITGAKSNASNAKISWSSSAGAGGSTVSGTLYWVTTGSWSFTYRNGYSITINGSSNSGSGAKQSGGGTKTLLSHSVWVGYTGNKSISISGSIDLRTVTNIQTGSKLPIYTCSATVALDKVGTIPTMPSFTSPSSYITSEAGGTISVRWNASSSYSGSGTYELRVQINGGSWTTIYQPSIGTTSYNYSYGAGQGNTYQFAIRCSNDVGTTGWAYSGNVTTNQLSAPSISYISTYNPYTHPTLNVSLSGGGQTNGGNICRMCALYYGDTWLWEANFSSVSWNNTSIAIQYAASSYLAKLGARAYSSNNFRIVAWCENANRSRSGYVSRNFTVNINTDGGATPTLGKPTLSGGILGYPSTVFVSGINDITVKSQKPTLRRAHADTTISYKISMTGASSTNYHTAIFSNVSAGTKDIEVVVTDSRGLSASTTVRCIVQPWSKPTLNIVACERIDESNTARLDYEIAYSPIYEYTTYDNAGQQLNNIGVQQYKVISEWNDATSGMILTGIDTELSYSVQVRCSDLVSPTSYSLSSITVPTIRSLLSLRGHGIGVWCVPSKEYALDVTGNARFTGTSLSFTQHGATQKVIEISGGDATGLGVKLGAGGGTTLFSGEAGNLIDTNSSEYFNIASDGQINLYTGCDGGTLAHRTYISAAGNMYCDGNLSCKALTQTSDERLKQDIHRINDVYGDIWSDLTPKLFKWNNDSKTQFGIMAQDIVGAFGKHGLDYKDYGIVSVNDDGYFGVAYDSYNILTAHMLKNTIERVNNNKDDITSIKESLNEIKQQLGMVK